jgi:hypothetical protein
MIGELLSEGVHGYKEAAMKYIACPKCHEENPEHNIHCSVCGTRLNRNFSADNKGKKTSDTLLKRIFAGLHIGKRKMHSHHTGGTARPS